MHDHLLELKDAYGVQICIIDEYLEAFNVKIVQIQREVDKILD